MSSRQRMLQFCYLDMIPSMIERSDHAQASNLEALSAEGISLLTGAVPNELSILTHA